jgi:hypothetical protein
MEANYRCCYALWIGRWQWALLQQKKIKGDNMRNIQMVLERWGGWAASDHSGVSYSHIAAGFKGLLPHKSNLRLTCSDNDGLIVDGCLCRLLAKRPLEYNLLVAYYVFGVSKRKLAKARKKDEKLIRIEFQMAEGFVEGCLSMTDEVLDMDIEVTK